MKGIAQPSLDFGQPNAVTHAHAYSPQYLPEAQASDERIQGAAKYLVRWRNTSCHT